MRLGFFLLALSALLTQRVVPESGLVLPALGFLSCVFLPDPLLQAIVLGFSFILWLTQ